MANAEDARRKPSDMAQPSPLSPLSPSELRDEASETSSSEEQHLAFVVPFARRPLVSTSTSFPQYPPEDQQEELRTSVGEDETRSASVLPASTPLSPLSVGVLQEAAQTTLTTGTATVTAHAVSTTIEPSSPLDHVLIIGHGRFQRIVLACTTLAFFTTIVHAMASMTLARSVDHWCSLCHRYDPPFDLLSDEAGHDASADNRSVIPCDAGWHFETGPISDGPDYHGHSGKLDFKHPHSIVVEWNLVCGRKWIVSALRAAYTAGGFAGAPVAGIAADRIGRRPVLCLWLVLLFFAGTMLVFALTVPVFAALRFLLSAGAAGVIVASHVLLFEVTGARYRASYYAVAIASGILAADVYSELIYVCIPNWHLAQVAFMIPSCGMIVAVYLMEESPCWLVAVSEMRYAESVLAWAAGANNIEPSMFRRRLSRLRIELNQQNEQPAMQQEPEGAVVSEHEVRVSDLLSKQHLRRRSAVIFGCWFLVFGAFAHFTTTDVLRKSELARIALVLLRLPCIVADIYAITRAGRRLSLGFSMLALSVVATALSVAELFGASAKLSTALVISGLLAFDLSAVTLFAFSAELYPTVLRGTALGCCYMSGRLGAFVAPFVNLIPSPPLRSVAYAVSAAMLLVLSVMAFALPETRQLPPSNTMQGMLAMEEKWLLGSPLRVARGGGKRRRPRTTSVDGVKKQGRGSSLRQLQ
ncbi:organic cation transporter protein-like [Rhipicephalus microplus]|uniref:organic cation transporter protein-like n=1 Tax=Rhipicephalus microplus TaxID=6941 RepID=UPI003F6A65E6